MYSQANVKPLGALTSACASSSKERRGNSHKEFLAQALLNNKAYASDDKTLGPELFRAVFN